MKEPFILTEHPEFDGNAKKFAEEMVSCRTVSDIRAEDGNLRYVYFFPLEDKDTVLLIDSRWDQQSIDTHHASPMTAKITELREKYDLHMRVERYVSDKAGIPETDKTFVRESSLKLHFRIYFLTVK